MVRSFDVTSRLLPLAMAGACLLSLGGCVAAPLGQLAYQAAATPSPPCSTPASAGGCPSTGLSSMWDGMKGAVSRHDDRGAHDEAAANPGSEF
jgi:hypothetical protein